MPTGLDGDRYLPRLATVRTDRDGRPLATIPVRGDRLVAAEADLAEGLSLAAAGP